MRPCFYTEIEDQLSFCCSPWVWKLFKIPVPHRSLWELNLRVLGSLLLPPNTAKHSCLSMNVGDAQPQSHVGWVNGKFSVLFSSIQWPFNACQPCAWSWYVLGTQRWIKQLIVSSLGQTPEYKQFSTVLCAKELDSLHKVLQCIKESRYFRVCVWWVVRF